MQQGILTDRSGAPQDTTKNSLVIAATKLFAKQGYHGTSIADITNACELTKSSFFHHFANKELVAIAVIDYLTYLTQRIFAPVNDRIDDIDTILSNIEAFLISEEKPLRAFFNIELIDNSNTFKTHIQAYSKLWIDQLTTVISSGDNAHELAKHSLACIYGYMLAEDTKTCRQYLHRLWTNSAEVKIPETIA